MRVLLALSLALSAGASQATPDGVARMNAARDDWQVCVADRVREIDDGISPASDIATGVQSSCAPQFTAMLDTMTLGQVRYSAEKDRERQTRVFATRVTLEQRAAKRRAVTASAPRSSAP
jgi:hypothetical protein